MCSSNKKKPYSENYYRNMENGTNKPGRELLEAAAEAAGFTLEQCLQIPAHLGKPDQKDEVVDLLKEALSDWREAAALRAVMPLATMSKPKRPKRGGRTRKK
jgi:hypothetical protein